MNRATEATVMLVDDEVMVASTLQALLQLETGYRVLTYNDPLEALAVIEAEMPDVIVSDFMMPGMDGVTFLKHAREKVPFGTRILLTGYADKNNAIRAINEAGLYQYLEKPWDNAQLKLVIQNGVERAALFKELHAHVAALEGVNQELKNMRSRLLQAFL